MFLWTGQKPAADASVPTQLKRRVLFRVPWANLLAREPCRDGTGKLRLAQGTRRFGDGHSTRSPAQNEAPMKPPCFTGAARSRAGSA